ncbi:hypothetical protein GJ744_004108 [Endocarpon pusillum]|uniref:Uncharacterized protein n=1 Tax=Endocarpon pusillum TaxID=364733 RepID=A0A8H7AUT1_9EURO|nr:hypothetical protein GJ744_004108 [Endocarpon pusillum]
MWIPFISRVSQLPGNSTLCVSQFQCFPPTDRTGIVEMIAELISQYKIFENDTQNHLLDAEQPMQPRPGRVFEPFSMTESVCVEEASSTVLHFGRPQIVAE